jgi:hypothetical protein
MLASVTIPTPGFLLSFLKFCKSLVVSSVQENGTNGVHPSSCHITDTNGVHPSSVSEYLVLVFTRLLLLTAGFSMLLCFLNLPPHILECLSLGHVLPFFSLPLELCFFHATTSTKL